MQSTVTPGRLLRKPSSRTPVQRAGTHGQEVWARQACLWQPCETTRLSVDTYSRRTQCLLLRMPDFSENWPNTQASQTLSTLQLHGTARRATLLKRVSRPCQYSQSSALGTTSLSLEALPISPSSPWPFTPHPLTASSKECPPALLPVRTASAHRQDLWAGQASIWKPRRRAKFPYYPCLTGIQALLLRMPACSDNSPNRKGFRGKNSGHSNCASGSLAKRPFLAILPLDCKTRQIQSFLL